MTLPREDPPRSLRAHAIVAVALYVVDAFVLAQGALAGLVTMIMLLLGIVHVARGLFADRARIRYGLSMIGIYLVMMTAVLVTLRANNQLASRRADEIVVALRAYRAATGDYPARLEDLVPAYLPAVQRAKYTLGFGEFDYHHTPGQAGGFLIYNVLPPFGRRTYSLDTDHWGSLD